MKIRLEYLISEALRQPTNAISYYVSQELDSLYPGRGMVQGSDGSFALEAFVRAGQCAATLKGVLLSQIVTEWEGPEEGLSHRAENAWYELSWQDCALEILLISWQDEGCKSRHFWIMADSQAIAEAFLLAVCAWDSEVRSEVLVYDGGNWYKSDPLFHAIKSATFDNLILNDLQKQELQRDFAQFFASREMYTRYRIPWKRGVLFIGPPGNGKTHTVKALINWLGQPCLYVKSFRSRYETDQGNIRRVFKRARQTTPCILVMEDLDSLIDDKNRSFFLNELDGFAANTGIVVLATTNHPERLDPAILERPSRFDRKYYFPLPIDREREAYILAWNRALEPTLRISDVTVARLTEATEGFSFAYLKELFLSAMMRWIAVPQLDGMDVAIAAQATLLREQMSSMAEETPAEAVRDDDQSEDA